MVSSMFSFPLELNRRSDQCMLYSRFIGFFSSVMSFWPQPAARFCQTQRRAAQTALYDAARDAHATPRLLGLKTGVLDEMTETITLIGSLVEAGAQRSGSGAGDEGHQEKNRGSACGRMFHEGHQANEPSEEADKERHNKKASCTSRRHKKIISYNHSIFSTLLFRIRQALEDVFLDFMPDTCRHLSGPWQTIVRQLCIHPRTASQCVPLRTFMNTLCISMLLVVAAQSTKVDINYCIF